MGQGIELPRKFVDVPLADLWQYLTICDELKELAGSADDKAYWTGWHDCMSTLLGDLTGKVTIKLTKELADIFEDYRMEDRLAQVIDEFNDRNGSS